LRGLLTKIILYLLAVTHNFRTQVKQQISGIVAIRVDQMLWRAFPIRCCCYADGRYVLSVLHRIFGLVKSIRGRTLQTKDQIFLSTDSKALVQWRKGAALDGRSSAYLRTRSESGS
jgi:hypothetical protein